jgi:hypothetical protein
MGPRGKEGLGWLSFWEFPHPWALPTMRQEGKLIISCLNIWSSKGDKSRRDIRLSVKEAEDLTILGTYTVAIVGLRFPPLH